MHIHLLSAIAGAFTGAFVLLTLGQSPGPNQGVRIGYGPKAKDMLRVAEGPTPFVVPEGKVFVATGLAMEGALPTPPSGRQTMTMFVDGQPVISATIDTTPSTSTIIPIPPGIAAPAGAAVSCDDTADNEGEPGIAIVLGYLENG